MDLKQYDSSRSDFTPYGFTVEQWKAALMPVADRHIEIEINYVPKGSLTYLFGGRVVRVVEGEFAVFWGAYPHHVAAFREVDHYYVVTVPLWLALDWGVPLELLRRLLLGQVLKDNLASDSSASRQFARWNHDFSSGIPICLQALLTELRARLLRLSISVLQEQRTLPGSLALSEEMVRELNGSTVELVSPPTVDPFMGGPKSTESYQKAEAMAGGIARGFHKKLKVSDVAAQVGLQSDYASALFRRTLGITMSELLVNYRVTFAQRLLATSGLPIASVAKMSGFCTLSRFNAAFKQYSSITPRDYRQQAIDHSSLRAISVAYDDQRDMRFTRVE